MPHTPKNISPSPSALVLFSGGQDSLACLAWAFENYRRVETIGFDYQQRHSVELKCRKTILQKIRTDFPQWGEKLEEDHVLSLDTLAQITDSSLTRETKMAFSESGLPNSFVPGRNLLFFTYAAAIGYRRNLPILVGGMCETDYSGYPDCRKDTLDALQTSLAKGMEFPFEIRTPLMYLTKSQTWQMAKDLGGQKLVDLTIHETHTCYLGDHTSFHPWGYGCNTCPACELRRQGFEEWREGLGE